MHGVNVVNCELWLRWHTTNYDFTEILVARLLTVITVLNCKQIGTTRHLLKPLKNHF